MDKYVWIGHREAEIFKTNNFFSYSITSWGSNENGNISYCKRFNTRNIDNDIKNNFLIQSLKELFDNEDYKVMFYSSTLAYSLMKLYPDYKGKFICLNSKSILDLLNNKINTRLWLSNHMPVLKFILLSGADCLINNLKNYFPECSSFIIQEAKSSGGLGTFFIDSHNSVEVLLNLKKENLYLVSCYAHPSFSVNSHILITGDDITSFPPSTQIVEISENRLIYSGADFINYSYIDDKYKEKVDDYSVKIGYLLQEMGYRGICGIDFLIYGGEVYFVEINPRFQASTFLLNVALDEAGLPCIQELQVSAFNGTKLPSPEKLKNISVNYSFYRYKKEKYDTQKQYLDKLALLQNCPETKYIIYDGFVDSKYCDGTYLYQSIWNRHISSCSKDYILHLHPNIPIQNYIDDVLPLKHTAESIIKVKIALLNQGIQLLPEAELKINLSGGYNESVFYSIDLIFFKYLRINAPVNINLSSLSPFFIGYKNDRYTLYYYHTEICKIDLEFSKSIEQLKTKNDIPYKLIAFISGDRLRIKPERRCYFKKNDCGCFFCPGNKILTQNDDYYMSDIEEVINYCIDNEQFRHILIGGGSADSTTDQNRILPVIEYIHSKTDKQIYLMCLPPNDIKYIDKYIEAGVNEIAFNIELFDRNIALEYMPGKGQISLEEYLVKLEYAAKKINKKGSVRTMLIAGLESIENTLSAVELLVSKGIQPMISIFRPTNNCKLPYIVQPSNEEMYRLFVEADKICNRNGLSLGPTCPSCQNNTLAITLKQD